MKTILEIAACNFLSPISLVELEKHTHFELVSCLTRKKQKVVGTGLFSMLGTVHQEKNFLAVNGRRCA